MTSFNPVVYLTKGPMSICSHIRGSGFTMGILGDTTQSVTERKQASPQRAHVREGVGAASLPV